MKKPHRQFTKPQNGRDPKNVRSAKAETRPPMTMNEATRLNNSKLRINLLRATTLVAVIAISVYIFMIRDQAQKFAAYGYPGIFLISILANATVLLPAPGVAIIFAMGSVFNPFIVGIVAGLGSTIGELSGYMAGFSGQGIVERVDLYDRITGWMHHYGSLTIFILAAVPNPFFDLAGMAAGALKMPIEKFLFWCLLGKAIKMLVFAYAGAYSINWLSHFTN